MRWIQSSTKLKCSMCFGIIRIAGNGNSKEETQLLGFPMITFTVGDVDVEVDLSMIVLTTVYPLSKSIFVLVTSK